MNNLNKSDQAADVLREEALVNDTVEVKTADNKSDTYFRLGEKQPEDKEISHNNANFKEQFSQISEKVKTSVQKYRPQVLVDHLRCLFSPAPSKMLYLPQFDKQNIVLITITYLLLGTLSYFLLIGGALDNSFGLLGIEHSFYSFLNYIRLLGLNTLRASVGFVVLLFVYFSFGVKASIFYKYERFLKIIYPLLLVHIVSLVFAPVYPLFTIFLIVVGYVLSVIFFIFETFIVASKSNKPKDAFWTIFLSIFLYLVVSYIVIQLLERIAN